MKNKDAIRRRIDALEMELARLEALPNEPESDDDGSCVIWFTKQFALGGTNYVYAAVKSPDGLWYTTGPVSPKGYTWDELIEWIASGVGAVEIFKAVTWEEVS